MDNPMAYDEIKPVRAFAKTTVHTLPIEQLKELSLGRVAADEEFRFLTEDIDRQAKKDQANQLSLNEAARRAEMDGEKARDKQRVAERKLRKSPDETVIPVSLHDIQLKTGAATISTASNTSTPATDAGTDTAIKGPDEMRAETLNILSDLVKLSAKKTAPDDAVASAVKNDTGVKTP
jgi:hypothetical protein